MNYLENDSSLPERRPPRPERRVRRRRKIVSREMTERRETRRGRWVRTRKIKKIFEIEERYEPGTREPATYVPPGGSYEWSSGDQPSKPLPQRIKLSVRGTTGASGEPMPELDGDYILEAVLDDGRSRRWEHIFPAKHGFYRVVVTANFVKQDVIRFRAELQGKRSTVRWAARCPGLSKFIRLRLRYAQAKSFRWPRTVELTLLGTDYPTLSACYGSTEP